MSYALIVNWLDTFSVVFNIMWALPGQGCYSFVFISTILFVLHGCFQFSSPCLVLHLSRIQGYLEVFAVSSDHIFCNSCFVGIRCLFFFFFFHKWRQIRFLLYAPLFLFSDSRAPSVVGPLAILCLLRQDLTIFTDYINAGSHLQACKKLLVSCLLTFILEAESFQNLKQLPLHMLLLSRGILLDSSWVYFRHFSHDFLHLFPSISGNKLGKACHHWNLQSHSYVKACQSCWVPSILFFVARD